MTFNLYNIQNLEHIFLFIQEKEKMILSTNKPGLDVNMSPLITYLVTNQPQPAITIDTTSEYYANYLNGIYQQHQQTLAQQRFILDFESANYGKVTMC